MRGTRDAACWSEEEDAPLSAARTAGCRPIDGGPEELPLRPDEEEGSFRWWLEESATPFTFAWP